jgi:hypothetical protein
MKQCLFCLMLLAVVALSYIGTPVAVAQVPPGVVVDSIAPANDWTNDWIPRHHSYTADPKTGRLAFVTGTAGSGGNPVWLSSTDYGATWNSLTGFMAGARCAIAQDGDYNIHFTDRVSLASGAIAIIYSKDPNGDGTGLSVPVIANDTTIARTPNYPDIAVSKDGKHIIITAVRWNQMDTMFAFVSHDSGLTWNTKALASVFSTELTPKAYATRQLMWYDQTVAMGKNGYGIMVAAMYYDTTNAGTSVWDFVTETRDYGDTWSTPQFLPQPPGDYVPGANWYELSPVIVKDTTAHLATRLRRPGGQNELFEMHKVNGVWTYNQISHWDPTTTSYDDAKWGSLGLDTLGRLYCLYVDRNKSAFPPSGDTYQVFVAGSTDDGTTWTEPVRLTDKEVVATQGSANTHWPHLTRFPTFVPNQATGIFTNGVSPGLYGAGYHDITAWVQVRFPLSVVWTGPYDKDTRAPKPGGYAIVSKGAGVYNWADISGKGTAATGFYNPGTAVGDTSQRDDGTAGPFNIGFNFWYYGQTFSRFWIAANGLMSFSDSVLNSAAATTTPWTSAGYYDGNYQFPGPGNPFKNAVAAYYNDLDLNHFDGYGNGDAYFWTNAANDTCIIEWHRVGDFNTASDTTLTFEVILAKADSSVTILFNNVGNTGTAATAKVGIQASDTVGVYYTIGSYPAANTPAPGTGVKFKPGTVLGVEVTPGVPEFYALRQNYPNPFNPTTTISYQLARKGNVSLKIYNILGEEVAVLANGVQEAGPHTVRFDARGFASGVYLYRLQAGEFTATSKMVLLK